MSGDKVAFYWAVVGDSNPEPVAVSGEPGNRMVHTIGCPDPFPLDVPEPNVELLPPYGIYTRWAVDKEGRDVKRTYIKDPSPMPIPEKSTVASREKERAAAERRLVAERKRGVKHGYAGFGARAT